MIALLDLDKSSRSHRLFSSSTVSRARRRLEESPLFRGRSKLIHVDESDGVLVVEGRLPSYYLKQLLQTVLRDVEGVKRIENRVVVDWPIEP